MNKNVKIAKELIKVAKKLIADQKVAVKWNWKHPFSSGPFTPEEYNKKLDELNKIIYESWEDFFVKFNNQFADGLNTENIIKNKKGQDECTYNIPGTNLSFVISYVYDVDHPYYSYRDGRWMNDINKFRVKNFLKNNISNDIIFEYECGMYLDSLSNNPGYDQHGLKECDNYFKRKYVSKLKENIENKYSTLEELSKLFK